jgi:hypothetical protein
MVDLVMEVYYALRLSRWVTRLVIREPWTLREAGVTRDKRVLRQFQSPSHMHVCSQTVNETFTEFSMCPLSSETFNREILQINHCQNAIKQGQGEKGHNCFLWTRQCLKNVMTFKDTCYRACYLPWLIPQLDAFNQWKETLKKSLLSG